MKIGILSFAHPHAFGYLAALSGRDDIEVLTTDPEPRPGEPSGAEQAASVGAPYVDTLAELLAWQPDGVIVCTENVRHRAAVEEIAAAGVHVLCEKPLATSIEDSEAMIAACERAGVVLMTAYPVRFGAPYLGLKAAVDSGALGELRAISGSNNGKLPSGREWFSDPALAGGGALMDHTVHIADLLDDLMPQARATEVYARANTIMNAARAGSETGGLVSIQYDNSVIVTIDCSWSMPDDNPVWGGLKVQVLGTGGVADMDAFDSQQITGFAGGQARRSDYGEDSNVPMVEAFLAAVASGEQPQPDGRAGQRSMAIALAAYESVRTGQPAPVATFG